MTLIRQPRPERPTMGEMARGDAASPFLSQWADLPALLTVQQAADLLGLSRSTAYRAVERGELPIIRIGGRMRVPVARLLALMGVLHDPRSSTPAIASDHSAAAER